MDYFGKKKIQIYQQHPYVDYILNILANSLNKFKLKKKKKKKQQQQQQQQQQQNYLNLLDGFLLGKQDNKITIKLS